MVDSPNFPLVLGHSWLLRHKPYINWGDRNRPIAQWGPNCYDHCSHGFSPSSNPDIETGAYSDDDEESSTPTQITTSAGRESLAWDSSFDWEVPVDDSLMESSDVESVDKTPDGTDDWRLAAALDSGLPSNVPSEYSDLAEVFSKQKAMSLPPHRPYDCAIN